MYVTSLVFQTCHIHKQLFKREICEKKPKKKDRKN